jgi:hypothetical protein
MFPFPVYLLREVLVMKEWLLLVALRAHFRSLLYSLRRIRIPEIAHRFHSRFVDPIPHMGSLLLSL